MRVCVKGAVRRDKQAHNPDGVLQGLHLKNNFCRCRQEPGPPPTPLPCADASVDLSRSGSVKPSSRESRERSQRRGSLPSRGRSVAPTSSVDPDLGSTGFASARRPSRREESTSRRERDVGMEGSGHGRSSGAGGPGDRSHSPPRARTAARVAARTTPGSGRKSPSVLSPVVSLVLEFLGGSMFWSNANKIICVVTYNG